MASATLMPSSSPDQHHRQRRWAGGIRPTSPHTPVLGEYGHRTTDSEVFLTNWRRGSGDSWVVSAQWPGAHGFYAPVGGLHDPLLLIETVRQAGILLSHVAHRVPLDHPIAWQHVRYALAPHALRTADAPAEVELRITDHDVVRRGKRLISARQEFRVRCDGAHLAHARLISSCHSPAVYRRLRGRYSDLAFANSRRLPVPEPVGPRLVGRDHERDVVLSPTDHPDRWQLRVDTSHPVLFGHPVDHAPGMLMVEAARQAAQAVTPGVPTLPVALECSFERYAELDAPSWVWARTPEPATAGGARRVEVGVEQHGRPVAAARITGVPVP
ncbi:ScbA/BarX family gamma-butyrolactone biosynthesis protein [Streptomyces endophytica]|uniref:ScbA/BarX family gamma-butyrolactone biosynthesis protein n=1 Tax=Streptomyces endophytica TaxID=2991496 RepID=A0ABY6PKN9_9ACTN|nr:ScbA/BarX family gamma-butyrolactone biosynthesis protein [Streptomyces endophytica]UZJ33772.1 ScbA/BarX family gamma-butyrolactone biosynthesis protein [Streptomyces endophytica]